MIVGTLTMWAIALGLPALVMEKLVSSVPQSPNEHQPRWQLRLISFATALVLAGFWLSYVFLIQGQREFTQPQVVGTAITALISVAAVCWWASTRGIPPRVSSILITLYTTIGVGIAFSLVAAPTDSTGLWGVGLIILTAASLGLGLVLTTMANNFFYRKTH